MKTHKATGLVLLSQFEYIIQIYNTFEIANAVRSQLDWVYPEKIEI